jgi:hypothetical protein
MKQSKEMQAQTSRLKALTGDLYLNEQEQSIVSWLCEQDIWTVEAVTGIIDKARNSRGSAIEKLYNLALIRIREAGLSGSPFSFKIEPNEAMDMVGLWLLIQTDTAPHRELLDLIGSPDDDDWDKMELYVKELNRMKYQAL